MATGNQPPWKIFVTLAARKSALTVRKMIPANQTIQSGFFQSLRTTTRKRIVSIVSVPVTAIP